MSSNSKATWVRTTAIALVLMTAIAYLPRPHERNYASGSQTAASSVVDRAVTRPTASRTGVADSRAGQQDLGRVLAEMDSRMAAMASQIARLKQERRTGTLDESPTPSNRAASALTREEELQQSEARVQAQEDLIEATVVSERPDANWAPAAETAIRRMFESNEIRSLKLVDAQCRTTLCRIEIAGNEAVVDGGDFDQSFRRLLIHTPWQGQGFGRVYDPFGPSPTAVFFLAREGNALPQPTP
jgi:hypothetical protein